jgi:hypothetical protein
MDPVAQRLAVHSADLRRRASVHAIPDRSQRQKPPALVEFFDRRANARSSAAEQSSRNPTAEAMARSSAPT